MRTLAISRDKEEMLARLRKLEPTQARRWGRMNAHQMVCHLADAFRMATGEKTVRADTSLFKRTLLRWVVLWVPLRWPSGIITSPELDQLGAGTPPADFASDRARLEARVEAFTAETRSIDGRPHPYFGNLSDAAWLRWAWLHMDHHLRQFGA